MNNLGETKILQMQYIQLFQYYAVFLSRAVWFSLILQIDFILFFPYIIYLKEISVVLIVKVLDTASFFLLEWSDLLYILLSVQLEDMSLIF